MAVEKPQNPCVSYNHFKLFVALFNVILITHFCTFLQVQIQSLER